MLKKYYLGGFFGRTYQSNGIKTRLGSPVYNVFQIHQIKWDPFFRVFLKLPHFLKFSVLYSLCFDNHLVPFQFPLDTGGKSNVHMAFRRCPGRLLDVSSTFNLRLLFRRYYLKT